MSLLTQPSHTLLSCFALLFLFKQAESRAFLVLSKHAGRVEEEEKHLGSARAGWLGRVSAVQIPISSSYFLEEGVKGRSDLAQENKHSEMSCNLLETEQRT